MAAAKSSTRAGEELTKALFACVMSRIILANEQCFSLTTNQRTMAFQQNEQGQNLKIGQDFNDCTKLLRYQSNNRTSDLAL